MPTFSASEGGSAATSMYTVASLILVPTVVPVVAYAYRKYILKQIILFFARANKCFGQLYLEGNFAPVEREVFSEDLPVEGKLPIDLNGAYIRNGPNPALPPIGGYHWFDGDGMLHSVRIKDGKASYCNRYVQTARLKQEVGSGWPAFMKLGDIRGINGLMLTKIEPWKPTMGVIDTSDGGSTANTALAVHANKLLALNEGDLPYAVRVLCNGLVETIGRVKLAGSSFTAFTAHPKLDVATGELHFFSYGFGSAPYVRYGVLDASGALSKSVALHDLDRPTMMHDFVITQSYALFLHTGLGLDGKRMVVEGGVPFGFDRSRPSRFGVLRKDASDAAAMRWLELPAFVVMHFINAWEEQGGDVIKVYGCHHDNLDLDLEGRSKNGEEKVEGIPRDQIPTPYEYTLDLQAGTATMKQISPVYADFPVIHPGLVGRRCRWAWAAVMLPLRSAVTWIGIAKLDLQAAADGAEDALAGRIDFPPGILGGEAVFIPRSAAAGAAGPTGAAPPSPADEDDGYLALYQHDEAADKSYFVVYDARSMSSTPLARVALPQRVPYGFHGTFLHEQQLQQVLSNAAL